MPIYEYKCETCGHEFEELQKFSHAPIDICPKCGGPASRLISQSTFILKGSGWYVTDYAKKDKNSAPARKEKTESKETKPKESAAPSSAGASSGTSADS